MHEAEQTRARTRTHAQMHTEIESSYFCTKCIVATAVNSVVSESESANWWCVYNTRCVIVHCGSRAHLHSIQTFLWIYQLWIRRTKMLGIGTMFSRNIHSTSPKTRPIILIYLIYHDFRTFFLHVYLSRLFARYIEIRHNFFGGFQHQNCWFSEFAPCKITLRQKLMRSKFKPLKITLWFDKINF